MKMKRYFAEDARTALRELREEQGPNAVILSNRKVGGGVEIIAALDYEESLVSASLGNPDMLSEEEEIAAGTSGDRRKQEIPARQKTAAKSARLENRRDDEAVNQVSDPVVKPHTDDLTPEHFHEDSDIDSNRDNAHNGEEVFTPYDLYRQKQNQELEKIQGELKGLRTIMEAPLMQFSWGDMKRIQPLHASLLKQLMALGLSAGLCQQIASAMAKKGLNKKSWLEALKRLASMLPVADEDLMRNGGVVSLIGPTGVGKTTTIAKLAARFALRHGRRNIALVTTDSYRIGAHEQLRTYGRILGVPVQVAADNDELSAVLNHCNDKKLVLIDTSGVSQHDKRLAEQLATLNVNTLPVKNYLVMSSTSQMTLLEEVIDAFGQARLDGCFLTKIDEAASLGEVLSVLIEKNLPVAYISDGQKVPDDLHPARGELLVKEAVKLMQKANKQPSEKELAYMFGGMINNANT